MYLIPQLFDWSQPYDTVYTWCWRLVGSEAPWLSKLGWFPVFFLPKGWWLSTTIHKCEPKRPVWPLAQLCWGNSLKVCVRVTLFLKMFDLFYEMRSHSFIQPAGKVFFRSQVWPWTTYMMLKKWCSRLWTESHLYEYSGKTDPGEKRRKHTMVPVCKSAQDLK